MKLLDRFFKINSNEVREPLEFKVVYRKEHYDISNTLRKIRKGIIILSVIYFITCLALLFILKKEQLFYLLASFITYLILMLFYLGCKIVVLRFLLKEKHNRQRNKQLEKDIEEGRK